MGCELPVPGNVHCRSADDFALLAGIDGLAGWDEIFGRAITNFDECQTVAVQHDQVNFTAATTEVACDRSQSLRDEKVEYLLLRRSAYNSRSSECHADGSAASGITGWPSLLISLIGPPMSSIAGKATTLPF